VPALESPATTMPERRRTATSNFGVGRRESHDASAFYDRFRPPVLDDDDQVLPPEPVVTPFAQGDARQMDAVADGSVALVVTSPPYFAGKAYEEELERDGIPSSYLEYLELLRAVFAECVRKLEPGGRLAVNVANLGRKPYRSLSADVIRILQDDLGLLLRGELIWQKAEGATGSCAWGSFRSAANPVLRDITERVVVASKGRFDRARTVKQRQEQGLPFASTLMTDDFMALTLDIWSIPPERAHRVGHPAPFPVELPEQLIRLYTFAGDLVLDPFMGSGSTLVAAARLDRRYVGYDLDGDYVEIARRRVAEALDVPMADPPDVGDHGHMGIGHGNAGQVTVGRGARGRSGAGERVAAPSQVGLWDRDGDMPDAVDRAVAYRADEDLAAQAVGEGKSASKLAEEVLVEAGFTIVAANRRVPKTGVTVAFEATDTAGAVWLFDVIGGFTSYRGGLLPSDVVWRALGRASAIQGRSGAVQRSSGSPARLVFLASHLPRRPGEGDTALRAAGPRVVFDVAGLLSSEDRRRLARYATGAIGTPLPGYWDTKDLVPRLSK